MKELKVIKKDGRLEEYNREKILNAVDKSAKRVLVDLTPDIQGIEVVMNNNLDGTLTCYARHNGYYSSIVTQVTQCDGLGFIDFINLDNFDTSKDSLLNIVSSVNTIYDLSFTYQNDWQDLKNSRPTIIKRKGDPLSC